MRNGIKILLGMLAISTTGFAETKPIKFGSEVRVSIINSDDGFNKTDTFTPDSNTSIKVERFNFQLIGDIEENLSYRWRLNALTSATEYAYIRWKTSDMLTISAGKGWVAQGGIAYFSEPLKRYFLPQTYIYNTPMSHYKEMIQFDLLSKSIGNLSIQVFDDDSRYNAWNNGGTHPTFAFMFMTKAAGFSPMVQYGSYDNNHSMWYSVGSKFEMSGVSGFVNYLSDARAAKDTTGAEPTDAVDTLTNIDLEVAYAVSKKLSPYVFYSKFDRVQHGTDLEFNPPVPMPDGSTFMWYDNGTTMAVGANYQETENLSTYVAYYTQSGDYPDAAGKAETKTETQLRVGLTATY